MPLSTRTTPVANWLRHNWRWLLVLSVLPLFASKALYHVPLILLALLGLIHALRHRLDLLRDPAACFIVAVFLALWLPQLIALFNAVEPAASLRVTLTYVGYPLAALFIMTALQQGRSFERLVLGMACVVAVWAIDVLAGASGLTPWPAQAPDPRYFADTLFGRLSLGHVVAVLSPFLFELVRRQHRQRPWIWLLLVLTLAIVLLSGRRVAWLLLLIAATAYLIYLVLITRRPPGLRTAIPLVLVALLTATLYWLHEPTRQRLQDASGLFSADIVRVDHATSHRLDIWNTAWHVARDNWQTGIGVRGFRHVYADYASADDFWLEAGVAVNHPHLFVLEIAAETGVPGLIGYLIVWWLLWRLLRQPASLPQPPWKWPAAIALGVALLPFNAHFAFYGAYWSAVLWWLIGLQAAAAAPGPSGWRDS